MRILILLWGMLTLLPFIAPFYFEAITREYSPGSNFEEINAAADQVFFLGRMLILFLSALLLSFLIYVGISKKVPSEKRARWAILLLILAPLAMPMFWYLYVWRKIGKGEPDGEAI